MRLYFPLIILLSLLVASCRVIPKVDFSLDNIPAAPDYANPDHWAALPDRKDLSDSTPESFITDNQAEAAVDVFFLHPTTYTGKRGENLWNGPVDNESLNIKTDESAILHQASIFNGAGKIYAPRYRQAHYNCYFTDEKASAKKAFDLAYSDVKSAFEFYLKHYNNGRPIIIAAHSQGTNHATQILKDFFENKPLMDKLVVAYLVGMPIAAHTFNSIMPCTDADDLTCFCSWQTWQSGHYPKKYKPNSNIVVTNPLSWKTDDEYIGLQQNEGGVLRKFEAGIVDDLADAQVHQGVLWTNKPKFFGSIFITFKNYHIADFNLFYMNVRKNAMHRAALYLGKE